MKSEDKTKNSEIIEIDYRLLGEHIRKRRNMCQMKQSTLGELVGVNGNHISNIERNVTNVSLSLLYKISKVFNCTIDDLINEYAASNTTYSKLLEGLTDYEWHMIEDFMKSIHNNKKYLSEKDIS